MTLLQDFETLRFFRNQQQSIQGYARKLRNIPKSCLPALKNSLVRVSLAKNNRPSGYATPPGEIKAVEEIFGRSFCANNSREEEEEGGRAGACARDEVIDRRAISCGSSCGSLARCRRYGDGRAFRAAFFLAWVFRSPAIESGG